MINLSVYNGTTRTISYSANQVESLTYSQMYPGGLYATATFFIPGKLTRYLDILGGYRLVIRDGLSVVWLGEVTGIQPTSQGGREGVQVEATGDWGAYLNKQLWNKPWCDVGIDNNTWYETGTAYNAFDVTPKQIIGVDRNERICFTPKGTAFALNDYHRVRYSAPTGETVKRVTFNYDLQEAAQAWVLGLYNETSAASDWSVAASGTAAVDETLGTASQHIFFYMQAGSAQTPTGTIYASVTNVKVYTETGSINLTEVAKDVRAHCTSLDTSDGKIASNTLSLEPYVTNGYESCASILQRAASYGDSSSNPWACYLGDSETLAGDTFPAPQLVVEQQPVLTATDYTLSAADIPNISTKIDYDNIWNWIIVQYTDLTGKTQYITPDDNASLKDTRSVTVYGKRIYLIQVNTESSTTAVNYGKRFLAAYKEPKIQITSPISVPFLYGAGGDRIPATRVRAGKRLKITNYLNDITGAGMTFLITGTTYNGDTNTVDILTGQPDPLAVIVARQGAGMKW